MSQSSENQTPAIRNPATTIRRAFVFENFHGLHARPAALLVKTLARYDCKVAAHCHGETVNAKSILGLLGLAAGPHSKITFSATGRDSPDAMTAIERLFELRFEEAYLSERKPSSSVDVTKPASP